MRIIVKENLLFTAEVAKQLKLRGMNQHQLADAIHYSHYNVRRFMCGLWNDEGLKKAIAKYLNIDN